MVSPLLPLVLVAAAGVEGYAITLDDVAAPASLDQLAQALAPEVGTCFEPHTDNVSVTIKSERRKVLAWAPGRTPGGLPVMLRDHSAEKIEPCVDAVLARARWPKARKIALAFSVRPLNVARPGSKVAFLSIGGTLSAARADRQILAEFERVAPALANCGLRKTGLRLLYGAEGELYAAGPEKPLGRVEACVKKVVCSVRLPRNAAGGEVCLVLGPAQLRTCTAPEVRDRVDEPPGFFSFEPCPPTEPLR